MSKKVALLIGISQYKLDLNPLLRAGEDVEAMQKILESSVQGFDEVKTLFDPDSLEMTEAIEILFSDRAEADLALLYFSGYGIVDDRGKLYFATPITRQNSKGELIKATSVPANFIKEMMNNSPSKQQIVILDCCFGGTLAEVGDSVDIEAQLGGEKRIILTASNSNQLAHEKEGPRLSFYTNYLVEGIESGEADLNRDGTVSSDEWHEYAKNKVREIKPTINPEIYSPRADWQIAIVKVALKENKQKYRQEVKKFIRGGEISLVGRKTLEIKRTQMGLSENEAIAIEAEILKLYRQDYEAKLKKYEEALNEVIEQEETLSPETRKDLQDFQESLGLKEEDTIVVEARLTAAKLIERNKQDNTQILQPLTQKRDLLATIDRPVQGVYTPEMAGSSNLPIKRILLLVAGSAIAVLGLFGARMWLSGDRTRNASENQQIAAGTDRNNPSQYGESFSNTAGVPEGQFNYGGSPAWIPIRARVDAVLQDAKPEFELIYTLPNEGIPNSSNAINMLLEGKLGFVHSSRPVNSEEHMRALSKGYSLKEVTVALEAIAIVTHPSLNISGLTLAQLKDIYTGKVTNWQEVGGPDLKIIPYSISPSESSLAEYFDRSVMQNEPFGDNVTFMATNTNAVRGVATDRGAIYFGSAHEVIGQCSVKPIAIGTSSDRFVSLVKKPVVSPDRCPEKRNQLNIKAIQTGGYPILQPLFAIVKQDGTANHQAGQAYADLLLTDEGQKLIQKAGFIPIRCLPHEAKKLKECDISTSRSPVDGNKTPESNSNSNSPF
ncbi:MAG: substrate-binding domain-containing protein [Prochloraceae cyanobacterium]|nr:substrate-binding domain-containing protein [Prochloraceae cyanobacterium]